MIIWLTIAGHYSHCLGLPETAFAEFVICPSQHSLYLYHSIKGQDFYFDLKSKMLILLQVEVSSARPYEFPYLLYMLQRLTVINLTRYNARKWIRMKKFGTKTTLCCYIEVLVTVNVSLGAKFYFGCRFQWIICHTAIAHNASIHEIQHLE